MMTDEKQEAPRRFPLLPPEADLIREYLAYRLAQLQKQIEAIRAVHQSARTPQSKAQLRSLLQWAAALKWATPGGRGQPKQKPKG